jgi:outer membrane receptor protein involved in Fe transport
MTYFGRNFADYDPNGRMSALVEKKVWQMPDATIVDLNFNYKFKIGNLNATFYGNVTNLLNQEYIADATDGTNHDEFTSTVWYGFGRTWSTGLRVKF